MLVEKALNWIRLKSGTHELGFSGAGIYGEQFFNSNSSIEHSGYDLLIGSVLTKLVLIRLMQLYSGGWLLPG